jgi:hypothetical protein
MKKFDFSSYNTVTNFSDLNLFGNFSTDSKSALNSVFLNTPTDFFRIFLGPYSLVGNLEAKCVQHVFLKVFYI